MRVRVFELRLLGLVLTALWATVFGVVLIAYRPGGPIDLLVGLAAAPPIAIALAAVIWPPVARGDRAFAAMTWLGVAAVLVLAPSIGGIVGQLQQGGPQTLMPSVEAAYPWFLALGATGLYAGLGIARQLLGESAIRRRRLVRGVAFGLGSSVVAGGVFAGAAMANELALRDRAVASSRFGPTDPAAVLPDCHASIRTAASARVELTLDLTVDGKRSGSVDLSGTRSGQDVRWVAFVAGGSSLGQHGAARIGDRAWRLDPGRDWTLDPTGAESVDRLDAQVVQTALTPANRAVAETVGVDVLEGARALHCRIVADGAMAEAAAPQVALLVGNADLSRFRGHLDYWVFADGEVGRIEGSVNGDAGGIARGSIQATIDLQMLAFDRDTAVSVTVPR